MAETLDQLCRESERIRLSAEQVRAVIDPLDTSDTLDAASFALMEARLSLRRAIARIERRDTDTALRLVRAAERALENVPRAESLERECDQRRAERLRGKIMERVA